MNLLRDVRVRYSLYFDIVSNSRKSLIKEGARSFFPGQTRIGERALGGQLCTCWPHEFKTIYSLVLGDTF